MPWLAINEKNLPQFTKGEKIEVSKVELYEVIYIPPPRNEPSSFQILLLMADFLNCLG